MGMKTIYKVDANPIKAIVRGKNDYGEYVVSFYAYGLELPDSKYYSDDKNDAIGTAALQAEWMRISTVAAEKGKEL